jgi:hypothetical protein
MTMSDDEISAALLLGTEMNPERFELVPDGPWIKALRERTGQKDLFVYHHRKSKMFGLACWSVKPKVWGQGIAVCVELCVFSSRPEEDPKDLPDMEWIESRVRPGHVVVEEERKARLDRISERQLQLLERKSAMDDMAKILRQRGLNEAADNLSLEDVPDNSKDVDEMRELLNWAMQGKIISTG